MRAVRLLERERELATLRTRLRDARAGTGQLLMVRGPAGIGKTGLLDAASTMAGDQQMQSLAARGGPLEQDFPYGVVRTWSTKHRGPLAIHAGQRVDQTAPPFDRPTPRAALIGVVRPGRRRS